ncbi:MAG: extracellular solute-binding protein [Clostridia bacterium]|nr:extracellular solute-binding protein [Clostridia bacterium]
MKRKGLGALFFVLVFCMLLFCGCSEESLSKADPVKITIWHYYSGAQQLYFNQLVNDFNATEGAKKGIIVEAKCKGTISELSEKVFAAASANPGAEDLPEIFAAYPEAAYKLYKDDVIVNYRDFFSSSELDEFVPAYLKEGFFNGSDELMLIPVAKSTEELFINKTAWDEFSQATGADIKKLDTWEGIVETAKRYYEWTDSKTSQPGDGKSFFGRDSHSNYLLVGYSQLCGDFFEVNNGVPEIHADKAALRKLWDCFYVPMVEGWYGQYGKFRSDDLMTGDIIAFVGSSSAASYFPESVTNSDGTLVKIKAEVLPVPNFEGKSNLAVQQGAGLAVSKQGKSRKQQLASIAFIKWFTSPEQNIKFTAYSGYMPVTKEASDEDFLKRVANQQRKAMEDPASEAEVKAVDVGLRMLGSYDYFVSKPFEEGSAARKILDASLINKARADAESIRSASAGSDRSVVAKAYETNENFESWVKEFLSAFAGLGIKTDLK